MLKQAIKADILRNSFLFTEADDEVLQEVIRHCKRIELPAGQKLYEQESEPDAMYILEDGQIHLVRRYPDGHEVILATKIPDHVIGELSMLSGKPHTGSIVAVGDCDLIKISRDAVYGLCEQFPTIAAKAMTHLAARLHYLNLHVREHAIGNTKARVASALLMLANDKSGKITHPISIAHLARATAMEQDRVKHTLKKWAGEGVLSIQKQDITIEDVEALKSLAASDF